MHDKVCCKTYTGSEGASGTWCTGAALVGGGGSSIEAKVACIACSIAEEGSDFASDGLEELILKR